MEIQEKERILNDAVVVFLVKNSHVFLATKMKKIGKGKLNSWGGGIEKGETSFDAGVRELEEETRGNRKTGVIVHKDNLSKVAIMDFHNTTSEGITFVCKVHMLVATKWEGEIISTEDMADPKLYSLNDIPLDQMMPADRVWFPKMFSGRKFVGKAKLSPRQETLIGNVEIIYVDSFPDE
jgi:8-oxo-dGTP pyrophosphatase MutT (NUDIX family)